MFFECGTLTTCHCVVTKSYKATLLQWLAALQIFHPPRSLFFSWFYSRDAKPPTDEDNAPHVANVSHVTPSQTVKNVKREHKIYHITYTIYRGRTAKPNAGHKVSYIICFGIRPLAIRKVWIYAVCSIYTVVVIIWLTAITANPHPPENAYNI